MNLLRAGICGVVVFAVLAHGAVEPWSESVLQLSAALLLVWWGLLVVRDGEANLRSSWLLLPVLGLVIWAMIQWLVGLSAYPHATKVEFVNWAALLLLVFLFQQAFRTVGQLRGFIWFLLVFGFLVAVFGILQHETFNGKLYWLRELSAGGIPFGPFVNRNHFAGLMELIAAPGLALLFFRGVRREWLPLAALFTVVPVGALFLSGSRGGVATFLFQLLLLAVLLWLRPAGRKGMVYATLLLLLVAGFLMWLDVSRVFDRFAEPQTLELSHDRRVEMVRDTWRIFLDHPVKGIGFGALVSVFPRYESVYDGRLVDHAHNDLVELLAEGGILGGVLGLVFLLMFYASCLRRLGEDSPPFVFAARAGALVACSGLLLHGMVDFNLHIPSNALVFLLMAVLATVDVPSPSASKPGSRHLAVVFSA